MSEPRPTCPDGGRCHHSCTVTERCWRVENAGPLSITDWDTWPAEILDSHLPTDGRI